MPRIVAEIPQTYDNIVRPVSLEIARNIARILNLGERIEVFMPGRAETIALTGTTIDEQSPGDPAKFGHTERLQLEITENPVEDRVLSTAVHIDEFTPFFMDKELGVRMYPVMAGTELQFRFTYRGNNRTRARQLRNEIQARTAAMREAILHEMSFYYHVPYVFLHLLKEIYTLREAQGGYGQTWDEYVQAHITPHATTITDQIGQNQALAISVTQTNSWGNFDFIATAEEESKDKEGGTWFVEFGYKLTFDQPIVAVAVWPLMIHNQLISEVWRSQPWASGDKLIDPDRRKRFPSLSRHAMDYFTWIYTDWCKKAAMGGVVMPNYDEWQPAHVTPNTSTLFSAMVAVDKDTLNIEVDLSGDLDDHELDRKVLDFMKAEAPYMNIKGASVVDVRLYRGEYPMNDGTLVIDDQLVVRSKEPLDIREQYHLRFSLVNDLFTLTDAAFDRLRQGGEAAIEILKALQWMTLGKAFIPPLLGGRVIKREDLRGVAQRINDLKVPHRSDLEYRMITVNNVLVVAHRSKQDVANLEQANGSEGTGAGPGPGDFTVEPECCS